MRVEHLAIDGAVVVVEAEADLSSKATAAGWAVVPSLMRAHPFAVCPPGHSTMVEETVKSNATGIKILGTEEYSLKGGTLRVGEVELPTATGETRVVTVGGWEGASGCLTTSLVGPVREDLVEVFDTLQFSERPRGLAIDSPVTPRPREPEVIKEIPRLGVLNIRPAIPSVLEQVPKARGRVTDHGELFRIRTTSNALMFVTETAVVKIDPFGDSDPREMVAIAQTIRVEWQPGAAR